MLFSDSRKMDPRFHAILLIDGTEMEDGNHLLINRSSHYETRNVVKREKEKKREEEAVE